MPLEIIHLGGAGDLTGSCHYLQLNGIHILIDCGITQGLARRSNMRQWPVHPSEIDYLFITHAHIDHMGRIPELVRNGFKGEILTTHATKAFMIPMLENALIMGNHKQRDRKKMISHIDDITWGFEFNESFQLKKQISFKLGRAGHILGSCFVCLQTRKRSVAFSGDLGMSDTPILCQPDISDPCELLCLESTYGNSEHDPPEERIQHLGKIITHIIADQGKLYIPSFSLGRAQELLYEINRLLRDPVLGKQFPEIAARSKIPVFLDTPMGAKIKGLFAKTSKYWLKEASIPDQCGKNPIDFNCLYAVENYHQHLKLMEMSGPAIIISGSAMCTGGRILSHLQSGLPDWRNDILFTTYQVPGTLGNEIIRFGTRSGGYVYIDNNRVDIQANIHVISGYSCHADQKNLIQWVNAIPHKPELIKLVHGDPDAQSGLITKLTQQGYCVESSVPKNRFR